MTPAQAQEDDNQQVSVEGLLQQAKSLNLEDRERLVSCLLAQTAIERAQARGDEAEPGRQSDEAEPERPWDDDGDATMFDMEDPVERVSSPAASLSQADASSSAAAQAAAAVASAAEDVLPGELMVLDDDEQPRGVVGSAQSDVGPPSNPNGPAENPYYQVVTVSDSEGEEAGWLGAEQDTYQGASLDGFTGRPSNAQLDVWEPPRRSRRPPRRRAPHHNLRSHMTYD